MRNESGKTSSSNQSYHRHKVAVILLVLADGSMHPENIIWDDGRRFNVEQCGEPTLMRCKRTEGEAVMYPIRVNGQLRELYRDGSTWFVEICGDESRNASCDPRRGAIPE